ncbi:neutral/alkaline non-lysosomal ceramidase N-terminal domain-containing protein [Pontibacter sp. E15-1]|uniref:neutral/alkaline non-lysosomal ceramidase N-terminal domain-containing protein n=1 Tax=Pontibacter sp. E15-1 TaxID=2919918 RepID=UPI001F4F247B|nr:neutral/alkaline non-lysosomal ceramidase N-terminal domain-containing protein [Pontibacter sp. E15-1]MCJ8166686.1 neutral/alkaline non-lysosomal ceramidase N-terminal domain-containing protein [Pontibacter sp. E15-1]
MRGIEVADGRFSGGISTKQPYFCGCAYVLRPDHLILIPAGLRVALRKIPLNWYWLLLLLLLPACVLQRIDRTPYAETAYFEKTVRNLQSHPATVTTGDTLQVGWAKVNITPPPPAPLAGYGKRLGMDYEQVHDSAWVRTFAFDNGQTQAYFVSLDMLIVPMLVLKELEKEYPRLGLKPEQVYLSATHSHTSFGGWGRKVGMKVMTGAYDAAIVHRLTQQIIQSMQLARQELQPTRVGYGSANAASLVKNRLTKSREDRDTALRFLKFERPDGTLAILSFFSAHPTILPSMQPILSRDYPGVLVDALEERVAFAAFSAGAVGSHSAVYLQHDSFESTEEVGERLSTILRRELYQVETAYMTVLGYNRASLQLPEPQWRISENLRLAPALFRWVFGRQPAYVTSLQLGNIVLLGAPADYSGEFVEELQRAARRQGLDAIVTSFNGGYIGYVTPDRHYNLDEYETRSMSFFGPYSGSYLTDMLLRLMRQHATPADGTMPRH